MDKRKKPHFVLWGIPFVIFSIVLIASPAALLYLERYGDSLVGTKHSAAYLWLPVLVTFAWYGLALPLHFHLTEKAAPKAVRVIALVMAACCAAMLIVGFIKRYYTFTGCALMTLVTSLYETIAAGARGKRLAREAAAMTPPPPPAPPVTGDRPVPPEMPKL